MQQQQQQQQQLPPHMQQQQQQPMQPTNNNHNANNNQYQAMDSNSSYSTTAAMQNNNSNTSGNNTPTAAAATVVAGPSQNVFQNQSPQQLQQQQQQFLSPNSGGAPAFPNNAYNSDAYNKPPQPQVQQQAMVSHVVGQQPAAVAGVVAVGPSSNNAMMAPQYTANSRPNSVAPTAVFNAQSPFDQQQLQQQQLQQSQSAQPVNNNWSLTPSQTPDGGNSLGQPPTPVAVAAGSSNYVELNAMKAGATVEPTTPSAVNAATVGQQQQTNLAGVLTAPPSASSTSSSGGAVGGSASAMSDLNMLQYQVCR